MTLKKKLHSALLIALAMLTMLVSCGGEKTVEEVKKPCVPDETIVESDDKYRNFYEIFVRSFKDSDGDGYGDFNGITQKLDYLKPANGAASNRSLGINAIWLMPICPSPSYHKYDISDYCAIDPMYGTMEDFENLLAKCHERNIKVIIDMVLNHTSRKHPWFDAFCELIRRRESGMESEFDPKYAEYYTYVTQEEMDKDGLAITSGDYTYYKLNGKRYQKIPLSSCYYECNFSDDMPELNYDSPYVWEEVEKICDFWINKGVDGFRFDAVLYFYFNDTDLNTQVLKRICDYCKSKKTDFYTVGEAWTANTTVRKYFNSGFDSFFDFSFANSTGYISSTVKSKDGAGFAKKLQNWNNQLKLVSASDAIDAPFLSNHDMSRSSAYFATEGQRKMAASLYLLMPGNTFIYYGEEIGLKGSTKDSSKKDPTARTAIKWSALDDGSKMILPDGADSTLSQDSIDGVEEQLKDEDSLLTHYRLLLKLKNQNPQIARGTVTAVDFGKQSVCSYTCIHNGTAVMVLHNLSLEDTDIDLSATNYSDFTELRGYVVSKNGPDDKETDGIPVFGQTSSEDTAQGAEKEAVATLEGGKLHLPGRTTVVLRSTEHYDDVVINPDSITTSPEDEKIQTMDES